EEQGQEPDREQWLQTYIRERLPTWNDGKRNDFIQKLTTDSAKELATARVERLAVWLERLSEELDHPNAEGALEVVWHFVTTKRNPSLSRELMMLELQYCHGPEKNPAAQLIADIRTESAGER